MFLWVVHHRTGWLDPVFVGITLAATGGWIWIAFGAALAWARRRPLLATTAVVAAAVWLGDLVSYVVKAATDRPRPFAALHVHLLVTAPRSSSMPSSHAATSFAGAVVLGLLFGRRVLAPALVLAAAVAYSRVYVGVHYPSDVLVGAAVGAATAIAVGAAARTRRVRRLLARLPDVPRRRAAAGSGRGSAG